MCSAGAMPSSLQRVATSRAANMAAYGEDSHHDRLCCSLFCQTGARGISAEEITHTFMPPVTREMCFHVPTRSVLFLAVSDFSRLESEDVHMDESVNRCRWLAWERCLARIEGAYVSLKPGE